MFIDILATFYNSSGSYVNPQRISKTIGEITKVTSTAVIHSISPSPQQDILPLHPKPTQSPCSISQSFIWATIPVSTFAQENPLQFFQSIGFNPQLFIYQRLLTMCHLVSWPNMRALQFSPFGNWPLLPLKCYIHQYVEISRNDYQLHLTCVSILIIPVKYLELHLCLLRYCFFCPKGTEMIFRGYKLEMT